MKLSKKAIISIGLVILLLSSGIVAWTQFFDKKEVVVFQTTMGIIEIELYRAHAPITVANFLSYVKSGFYNGTVFHRVYDGFVIQGGGFTSNETEKTTGNPIKLESNNGLKNLVGTIAMARTNTPDSATSQFFINLVDNKNLDYTSSSPGYAVFGKVISGMDVVNKIAGVEVETRSIYLPEYGQEYPFEKWPVEDIVITNAYLKP
jgi:peptidyl-prolyl cis-trans isomerase A (cyclophilin A)